VWSCTEGNAHQRDLQDLQSTSIRRRFDQRRYQLHSIGQWQFQATTWQTGARRRARDDLDVINDWVRNFGHPSGGQTHDRYNVDMSIAPHGDLYDDGGC